MMFHLHEISVRFWDELIARSAGPLGFRFVVQPVIASLLAIRDGYRDAIEGQSAYFWAVLAGGDRRERLRQGVTAVARVLFFACVADLVYQVVELKAFRPLQMLVIAFALGFIPYLLMRGPANRVVRWLKPRRHPIG